MLGGVLVAACGSSGSTGNGTGEATPTPPTPPAAANENGQVFLATRLRADYSELDRGVLAYSPLKTLKTGQFTEFDAWVTDIGKHAPAQTSSVSEVSGLSGLTVYPRDVPTGGILTLQVTCVNLTCQSLTVPSPRQAVVVIGQPVEWEWSVTANKPGAAVISLTADTYDEGTDTVLGQEAVQINLTVQATQAYKNRLAAGKPAAAGSGGGDSSDIIEGIFAIIAAAIGAIITRVQFGKRKKRRGEAAAEGASSAAGPAGQTPDS
jgi:hypothetical protein